MPDERGRGDTPPDAAVLLVVSVVPIWPVENGFQLRAAALVRELASRWSLVLVAPAADRLPAGFADLRSRDPIAVSAPWAHLPANHDLARLGPALRDAAARWRPAAVLFLCGAEYLAACLPRSLPTVADHVDCLTIAAVESLRAARGLRARAMAARDTWRMARFERALTRRMTCTIVAGTRDARALRRLGGDAPCVVPNGVATAAAPEWHLRAAAPTAAFSGVLDYAPNVDAARFLVRDIWPLVRRMLPRARLLLIGRRPTAEVRAFGDVPGVTVRADVADMRSALVEAWLAVAPMRLGSGVKNKVLEAWAAGRAVVLTPRAVNGLPLPPGHEALVAHGAPALAGLVAGLLSDPARLGALGCTAMAFARSCCTWGGMALRIHERLVLAVRA